MTQTASHRPAAEPVDPLRVWFRFVRLQHRLSAAVGAELRAIGLSIPQFDLLSTLTSARARPSRNSPSGST
jgi:hypothetical protein